MTEKGANRSTRSAVPQPGRRPSKATVCVSVKILKYRGGLLRDGVEREREAQSESDADRRRGTRPDRRWSDPSAIVTTTVAVPLRW